MAIFGISTIRVTLRLTISPSILVETRLRGPTTAAAREAAVQLHRTSRLERRRGGGLDSKMGSSFESYSPECGVLRFVECGIVIGMSELAHTSNSIVCLFGIADMCLGSVGMRHRSFGRHHRSEFLALKAK